MQVSEVLEHGGRERAFEGRPSRRAMQSFQLAGEIIATVVSRIESMCASFAQQLQCLPCQRSVQVQPGRCSASFIQVHCYRLAGHLAFGRHSRHVGPAEGMDEA